MPNLPPSEERPFTSDALQKVVRKLSDTIELEFLIRGTECPTSITDAIKNVTEQVEVENWAASKLSYAYFLVASDVLDEDEVRKRRDEILDEIIEEERNRDDDKEIGI